MYIYAATLFVFIEGICTLISSFDADAREKEKKIKYSFVFLFVYFLSE